MSTVGASQPCFTVAHRGVPAPLAERNATFSRRRAPWSAAPRPAPLVLIVTCWVLVVGTATAFTLGQEKQYSAAASLLFGDPGLDQQLFGTTPLPPSGDPICEVATNVKLVSLEWRC